MFQPHDTSAALMALYDAAYVEQDWVKALDTLCSVSDAKGVMIYASDKTGQIRYDVQFSNSLFNGLDDTLLEYHERFMGDPSRSHDMQGVAFVSEQPPFQPILDTDIWPLEHLQKVPEVQFTREKIGVFRRINFNLSDSSDLAAGLILQYDTRFADPPDGDVQAMPFFMPHVGKALLTNRFFSPLRQRYNAVLSMLDQFDLGICLLDERGHVVLANRTLRDLLDLRDGLSLTRDGYIRCQAEENDGQFRAAHDLVSKTASGRGDATDVTLLISRRGKRDPLLVIFSPLRDSNGEVERGLSGCMVTVLDTSRTIRVDMDAFGASYGLTPAECAVAALMRDGRTAAEIADCRSVSPETVATQIKSILAKTGTHSRVQFVWKLVQYAPPIS